MWVAMVRAGADDALATLTADGVAGSERDGEKSEFWLKLKLPIE